MPSRKSHNRQKGKAPDQCLFVVLPQRLVFCKARVSRKGLGVLSLALIQFFCVDHPLFQTKPCATCEEKEQEHESEVADQKPIKQQAKKALAVLLPNAIGGTRRVGSFFALSASWYNAWVQWVTEADNVIPPPPLDNKCVAVQFNRISLTMPFSEGMFCAHTVSSVLIRTQTTLRLSVHLCLFPKTHGASCASGMALAILSRFKSKRPPISVMQPRFQRFAGDASQSPLTARTKPDASSQTGRSLSRGCLFFPPASPQTSTHCFLRRSGTFDSVRAAVVEAGTVPSSSAAASAQEDVARRCKPSSSFFEHCYHKSTLTFLAATRLRTKTGTKVEGISCEWTVHALKNHLHFNYERELRCPVALQQVLIYERVVMEDEKPLTHYNIEEGSTVTLAVLDTSADASNFDEPIAPRRPETGFAGTMLVDSPSRPAPSSSASSASSNSATPRPIPPVFDDVVSAPAAPSEQPPAKRQKAEDPGTIQ